MHWLISHIKHLNLILQEESNDSDERVIIQEIDLSQANVYSIPAYHLDNKVYH